MRAARAHARGTLHEKSQAKLAKLCDRLGLQGEDRLAYSAVFERHMERLNEGLTPDEQHALDDLSQKIAELAKQIPTDSSKFAQFRNNLGSATIAWATGFGLVTLLVKTIALTPLRTNAIHFVNVAGPLILLMGEVLSGRNRAQGAGYAALDNAAYLSYSTLVSQKRRAELGLQGALTACPVDQNLVKKLESQIRDSQLKVQQLCAGLFSRELGTALNPDAAHEGVPRDTLLSCIRSGISVGEGSEVHLPDGSMLFTVRQQSSKSLVVVWPDGQESDLMSDPVPAQHEALFARAEDALLGAARCRSALVDEMPFMTFGMFYVISGAAGPWIVANAPAGDAGAVAADICLSLAMCWCGTQTTVHGQNFMRSVYGGAPVSTGTHAPHLAAKHELALLRIAGLKARIAELDAARSGLKKQLDQFKRSRATCESHEVEDLEKWIKSTRKLLEETKLEGRSLARDLRAAQVEREATAGHGRAVKAGAKGVLKGYVDNPPQLMAKLLGYTTTYIIYSQAFMYGVNLLLPSEPGLDPQNFTGNFTGSAINGSAFAFNGTEAAAGVPPEAWYPYMQAFAFNGFMMALGFVLRNNPITRVGEYAGNWVAGQVDAMRYGRSTATVEEVEESPQQREAIEAKEARQIREVEEALGKQGANALDRV